MKTTKRIIKLVLVVLLIQILLPLFSFAGTAEDVATLNTKIKSNAAIVMEASTGKVIYSKNSDTKLYPASTTKILTAIIALEECELSEMATVSSYAITSIPSGYTNANIQVGESLSVEDLLYALMLASANEAAIILGEHISGNYEDFIKLMNEKAIELGCKNTNFTNANGMHDKNHYTTAYDLALIAQYCMKNEEFRKIVSTTSYTLPATKIYPYNSRTFSNTNSLIIVNKNDVPNNYYYPAAIGIKTGYTTPAGNCLVSAANNNGLEFITVTLGATAQNVRYIDSINLFDFAFDNYSFTKIKAANNVVTTINIENATNDTKKLDLLVKSDIDVLTNLDNKSTTVEPNIHLNKNLKAPIKAGEVVGTVTYELDGLSYTTDLLAKNDVIEKSDVIAKIVTQILLFAIFILIIAGILIRKKFKNDRIKYKRSRHLTQI